MTLHHHLHPDGQLRLALDAAGMGAWQFVMASNEVRLDDRLEQLYGIEPGSFGGSIEEWIALVHPDDRARVETNLQRSVERGAGSFRQEYRVVHPDGAVRWLEGRGEVYVDDGGLGVCARGVTADVTLRKVIEADELRSRDRLRILAEAGHVLGASLQIDDTLRALGTLVVPALADMCEIDLLDEHRFRRYVVGAATDVAGMRELADVPEIANHPIRRVLIGGVPEVILLSERPSDFGPADEPTTARAAGLVAAILVPIVVHNEVIGVLSMSWRTVPDDMPARTELAVDLAARVGLAWENARLFGRQRAVSIEMQRSLLPDDIAAPDGFHIATSYRPGTTGLEVGGDWYDAVVDAAGRLHLSVGDVVGKGVGAASAMIRTRIALRSLMIDRSPSAALEALRDTPSVIRCGFVTILAATLNPDGSATVATAGHPPAIVVTPDGAAAVLDIPVNPPLGVPLDMPIEEHTLHLAPGTRLVMYTDGLVERRGEPIDDGIERLVRLLAEQHHLTADDLVPVLLDAMLADGGDDDAAVMIVDLPAPA